MQEPSSQGNVSCDNFGSLSWKTSSIWSAIQKKVEFSYAIAVMDTIGGWEEADWVGSRFAASIWIFTKEVVCDGQDHMQNYRLFKFRSNVDAVKGVCDDALEERMWVSELTISLQEAFLEALQFDFEIPCSQVENVVVLGTYNPQQRTAGNEAVNLAVQGAFTLLYWRLHIPRSCIVRSIRTFWGTRLRESGTWKEI